MTTPARFPAALPDTRHTDRSNHDVRHDPVCWCHWSYSGNWPPWSPAAQDADTPAEEEW